MDPISATLIVAKLKGLIKSPWLWAALLLVGVVAGSYVYLKHQTNELVATKIEASQGAATIDAYKTDQQIIYGEQAIDTKFDTIKEIHTKEYNNVRTIIQQAPAEQREAPVPALIIDTLNNLDRLRSDNSVSLPDDEVPVG